MMFKIGNWVCVNPRFADHAETQRGIVMDCLIDKLDSQMVFIQWENTGYDPLPYYSRFLVLV